jgi:hypothetical protein
MNQSITAFLFVEEDAATRKVNGVYPGVLGNGMF